MTPEIFRVTTLLPATDDWNFRRMSSTIQSMGWERRCTGGLVTTTLSPRGFEKSPLGAGGSSSGFRRGISLPTGNVAGLRPARRVSFTRNVAGLRPARRFVYQECGRAQAHSPSFVYDATVLSRAGDEQLVFNRARASVWEDENVLEIDGGECS